MRSFVNSSKGTRYGELEQWKGHVMPSVDEKNRTLVNKTRSRSINPCYVNMKWKNNIFSPKENFVIVPIDKAVIGVAT